MTVQMCFAIALLWTERKQSDRFLSHGELKVTSLSSRFHPIIVILFLVLSQVILN
jgi:hypothetical protein